MIRPKKAFLRKRRPFTLDKEENNDKRGTDMDMKISPSLLAADFMNLEDEIKRVDASDADMLHLDVMDGVYVPNISFGFSIIKQINEKTDIPLDVHMMTCCPEKYLEVLKADGADIVTVHSDYAEEAKVLETLKSIRALGMKAGLSLRPKCPWTDILPFIDYVDLILVMTVEPGFGGQKFMHDMMPKIRSIRDYIDSKGLDCMLEVDGGIGATTIEEPAAAGADTYVVGTAFFIAEDSTEKCRILKEMAGKAYNIR